MFKIIGIYNYAQDIGYFPLLDVQDMTWQDIVELYPDGVFIRLKDDDGNIGVFHGVETNTINTVKVLEGDYSPNLPDIEENASPVFFGFREITGLCDIESVDPKYYLAGYKCHLSQERVYRPTSIIEELNIDDIVLNTELCHGMLVYNGYIVPYEITPEGAYVIRNAYHLTNVSYLSCIGELLPPCGVDYEHLDVGNFDITHMTVSTSYSRIINGKVVAIVGGIIIDPKHIDVSYNNVTINLIDSDLLKHRDHHGPALLKDYDPTWTGEVYMQKIWDLGFNQILELDSDWFFMKHVQPYAYGSERYAPYKNFPLRDDVGRIFCYKRISGACKSMITTNAHRPRWMSMWVIPRAT